MLVIRYKNPNEKLTSIIHELEQFSLAYQLVQDSHIIDFQLEEGTLTIEGQEAILSHIREISRELHLWYYCAC